MIRSKDETNFNFTVIEENKDLFKSKKAPAQTPIIKKTRNNQIIDYLKFLRTLIILFHFLVLIIYLIIANGYNALIILMYVIISFIICIPILSVISIQIYTLKQINHIQESNTKKERDN